MILLLTILISLAMGFEKNSIIGHWSDGNMNYIIRPHDLYEDVYEIVLSNKAHYQLIFKSNTIQLVNDKKEVKASFTVSDHNTNEIAIGDKRNSLTINDIVIEVISQTKEILKLTKVPQFESNKAVFRTLVLIVFSLFISPT